MQKLPRLQFSKKFKNFINSNGLITASSLYLNKHPLLKKALAVVSSLALGAIFLLLGHYLFVIIPVALAIKFLLPSPKKTFFRIQSNLPTSKVHSLAIGLVEVEGKAKMILPMRSPVSKTECIGYVYIIEKEGNDSDGKTTWTVIHEETQCNPFQITDATGSVLVQPGGINFFDFDITTRRRKGNKAYSEKLLMHEESILLVGRAENMSGELCIKQDNHYNLLGVCQVKNIQLYNKYKPLLNSFLVTLFFIFLAISLILIA